MTDTPLSTIAWAVFTHLAHARHHRRVTVLDVRQMSEYHAGHIDGAINVPPHELLSRLDEAPPGEVWVQCASGYRATIAACDCTPPHRTLWASGPGTPCASWANSSTTRLPSS